MRKQTRKGRRKSTKRQTRKRYLQRGGAVVGLGAALSKLRFIMTLYSDNANVTAFLDRLLKVLETSLLIIPLTFPELEARYLTIPAWDQMRVPGAAGDTTPARKDALRAKILKYDLSRIPVAPGLLPITIHNDAQNDFGFEQNVNNIITASTQLFDTLVKTVDAAGLLNDAASKRAAFLERFNEVGWLCIDGTVSDILEFIANSEFIIESSQRFLLNVGKRISWLKTNICKDQEYFKLEKDYFLKLLQNDPDLQAYITKYKNGEDGVREKAAANIPDGDRPDVGDSVDNIIAAIFRYLIREENITISTIGTTEFVQACVDQEEREAAAVAGRDGPEATAARIQAAFEAKLRAKPQQIRSGHIAFDNTIIMKLLQVYNRTIVALFVGTAPCIITAVTPPTYTYTQNGANHDGQLGDIISIDFSYEAPV